MSVPNFTNLLSDVLNGEQQALRLWGAHTLAHRFDKEEIALALREIQKFSCDDSPQKAHALHLHAYMYRHGLGVEKNYAKAIELYDQAIALGNSNAMYNRALMHHRQGGDENYAEAIRLYEQAIALGDVNAMNNRAYMYRNAQGSNVEHGKAIDLYRQAIELNDANAMYNLAYMYQHGLGVEKSYEKAFDLYKQARELGNANAMYNLAYMYQYGLGIEKNYKKAFDLYKQASELGNAKAMYNLAYMYQYGLGVEKNYEAAIPLYDRVIKLGNVEAMVQRAHMYQEGLGGKVDYVKAIRLYRQADRLGNVDALRNKLNVSFNEALSKLKTKADQLKNDGHEDAYTHAMEIHDTLVDAHEIFQDDKNVDSFHGKCYTVIEKKRPLLDSHRGWSEFLINLAIAIPTFGIGLLIKGISNLQHKRSFFFVHQTETGKIVDEVERTQWNITRSA